MRYLSIDTETTGLNSENCQLLSVAGVLEDTSKPDVPVEDLPYFDFIIKREFIQGEPYALNMNKDLIEIIKDGKDDRLIEESEISIRIQVFCGLHGIEPKKLKVAGKNFSNFDSKFLDKVLSNDVNYSHRVLDVGSVFVDFKNDDWIPNLQECKKRANIDGPVAHDALEDARDVIRTLRAKY